MDEIKGTQQNSPQDKGKASEGSEETTPKAEAKTYTDQEIEEIKAKAAQNARVAAGRDAKSLEQREAAVKAREDANKAEQERRDAAELAEAQKDPDKLAVYQSEQAARQRTKKQDERDAAQDKREAEHEAEVKAAREAQKEITIWQIASAKGVDPVRLKALSEKFNIEGKEQLEELAGEIASGKPQDETPEKKSTPDSLVTSGNKGSQEGKTARQIYADTFREEKK